MAPGHAPQHRGAVCPAAGGLGCGEDGQVRTNPLTTESFYKSPYILRYHKTLEPGMNVLVPLIDKVKYVHSLKEITVDIPLQIAVTSGR